MCVCVCVHASYLFFLPICVFCIQIYILKCVFEGFSFASRAENQLNELEQRLAQTEKMLNSILTQLDPLTNW